MSSPFLACLLDVHKHLSNMIGVCDVKLTTHVPAERSSISEWETKNICLLPDDLKCFLLTSDGFQLTWFAKYGDTKQQIGKLLMNSVGNISKISIHSDPTGEKISFYDLVVTDDIENEDDCVNWSNSRVFELEPLESNASLCLVYRNCKVGVTASIPEFWLLDRSFHFHFIAKNFTVYYRLALMNLGLPQWQFSYTDIGLAPLAKQWFNVYSPLRLQLNNDKNLLSLIQDSQKIAEHNFDSNKVFKGIKPEKKKATGSTASTTSQKGGVVNANKKLGSPALARNLGLQSASSTTKTSSAGSKR